MVPCIFHLAPSSLNDNVIHICTLCSTGWLQQVTLMCLVILFTASDQSSVFYSAWLRLAVFVRGWTADGCRTLYMRSFMNDDEVYHLYFTMSAQFFLSVSEKCPSQRLIGASRIWLQHDTQPVISNLNLPVRWRTFYIIFLVKIYTISQLNKQIGGLQHNVTVCIYLLGWLKSMPVSLLFFEFCQTQNQATRNLLIGN